jgi:meiotically up-regulated gene 157 (Mug157) protein
MTKEKLAFKEAEAFEIWMREIVRSVHYADNEKMAEAYSRVFNNTLELTIYESTDKKGREPN